MPIWPRASAFKIIVSRENGFGQHCALLMRNMVILEALAL
jgi:hypothetical protein